MLEINVNDILKNKKVYLMINRYQGTGIGIEHDVARTYVNTAKQVGINLKHIYTDNFPFESDCMIIENDLNAFKPDYLIMYDFLLTKADEAEKQKWLSIEQQHYVVETRLGNTPREISFDDDKLKIPLCLS